jgi:hypothetical protein
MCETQTIRFAHIMTHPEYADPLAVGFECAANMEANYEGARDRERLVRNIASRRKTWLSRQWKISRNGSEHLTTNDGFRVAVFRQDDTWTGLVEDTWSDEVIRARHQYASADEVKLAALRAMLHLQRRRLRTSQTPDDQRPGRRIV